MLRYCIYDHLQRGGYSIERFREMSLMYSKKSVCRRKEPFGTPDVTSVMSETRCLRFDRTLCDPIVCVDSDPV